VKFRVKENLGNISPKLKKSYKTCSKGHKYYKTKGRQVCPVCEKENLSKEGFKSLLSAPAIRALKSEGISTLNKLSKFKVKEILNLHGVGNATILILKEELKKNNLTFREDN
jgi:hypothetical protein